MNIATRKKGKKIKAWKVDTGDKFVDALYEAVINYVESNQGKVLMINGISRVNEDERKYNYGIMVRITGRPPIFPESQ